MKSRLSVAAILVSALSASAAHAASIVSGPIIDPANQHTYYLLDESTWTDAQAFAQSIGGNLVTINDAAENAFVLATFGAGRDLWIGYNDVAVEGTFKWVSGETSPFINWRPGQPDNFTSGPVKGEDYGMMYGTLNLGGSLSGIAGQWNDAANDPSVYAGFSFANQVADIQGVVELDFAVPLPPAFAGGLVLLGGCWVMSAHRKMRMNRSVQSL